MLGHSKAKPPTQICAYQTFDEPFLLLADGIIDLKGPPDWSRALQHHLQQTPMHCILLHLSFRNSIFGSLLSQSTQASFQVYQRTLSSCSPLFLLWTTLDKH